MKKTLSFCALVCGLLFALQGQAGIYMGTEAAVPHKPQPSACDAEDWQCQQSRYVSRPGYVGDPFSIYVREGSLKNNIERIIEMGHWKRLIWKLPYDYKWIGSTRMSADSLEDLVARIVTHYPLQATFYKANRVVVITPRKKYHV